MMTTNLTTQTSSPTSSPQAMPTSVSTTVSTTVHATSPTTFPPPLTLPTSTWRLVIDETPRTGAANMAMDQAIAEACAAGESLPTLRFYRWQPPTITLGRLQPVSDIDPEAAIRAGYDIVRRSTGGRSILHIDELTYSVSAPSTEPRVQGNIMESYLHISEALMAGLRRVGVPIEKADGGVRAGKDVSAACFEVPSAYELMVGGRKLVGSAQSRRKGYVLQHGSLPLYGDITRLINVLALPDDERTALAETLAMRAATLAQTIVLDDATSPLSFSPSSSKMVSRDWFNQEREDVLFHYVADYLTRGFEQVLNITFVSGQPTQKESQRCHMLIRETFANPAWTAKK